MQDERASSPKLKRGRVDDSGQIHPMSSTIPIKWNPQWVALMRSSVRLGESVT